MKSFFGALALVLFTSTASHADVLFDLRRAVEMDNARAVRGLIQSGKATPDTWVPAPGMPPKGIPILGLAAREGSVNVAQYLIQAGADLNQRNPYNETPLMLASLFDDQSGEGELNPGYVKHEKIARMLIDAGADLENPNDFNPLIYSAFYGHIRITRYLLERGAQVNAPAIEGRSRVPTALMIAARNGDRKTILLLLEYGADTCIRDGWDHDATYMAKKYNHLDVLPLVECKAPESSNSHTAEPGLILRLQN